MKWTLILALMAIIFTSCGNQTTEETTTITDSTTVMDSTVNMDHSGSMGTDTGGMMTDTTVTTMPSH